MRVPHLFPLLPLLLLACAQPQALPPDPAHTGADCAHAIPIEAPNETAGVKAEYQWLKDHHPGAVVLGQSLTSCGDRTVDILTIRTKDSKEQDVYFDTSTFFGKY